MKNKNTRQTISFLFQYIRKESGLAILSIVFSALYVILSLYIPVLTGDVIDNCVEMGRVDIDAIIRLLTYLGLSVVLAAGFQWLLNLINNKVCLAVSMDIRNDAFAKIHRLPVGFFDSHSHGDILSRLTSDIEQLSDGLLMGFTNLFTGLLTILLTLVFMLRMNPLITLVVVVVTPVSLFVSRFIAKHTYDMFRLKSATNGEQTAFINETIENQKAVKAYNMTDAEQKRFDEINDRLASCSLKATFFSSLVNPCTRFVNSLVYALVGVFGALLSIRGGISVGQLSAFLSYASKYTKPFNEISGVITEFQNAFACAGRVFEFLSEKELPPEGNAIAVPDSSIPVISFKDVHFSYSADKPLITGFSLDVLEGRHIAIVGPTGCGKTTLINLIMRFYDVTGGKILLYGTDIRDVKRETLRENISMVLQDTWIREGTVRENICINKPAASDEEMIAAARAAKAHGFIKRLEKGYDTVLSEGGRELSQGQRQLICIARVMLDTPPILILDEATSSIDTRTEIMIRQAFDVMMEGRTSFIVAHRLSTILSADLILVMKDGNVIESGSHKELLAKNGFYTELYRSQFE